MADEPVSRILCHRYAYIRDLHRKRTRKNAAIIPLGHDSHRDSSSLPEGPNEPG